MWFGVGVSLNRAGKADAWFRRRAVQKVSHARAFDRLAANDRINLFAADGLELQEGLSDGLDFLTAARDDTRLSNVSPVI